MKSPFSTGRGAIAAVLLACLCSPGVSAAADRVDTCLQSAAQHHKIDYLLLRAIAMTESELNPNAVGRNTNGTVDHGLMQINDWWLPRLAKHGISQERLRDPCVSAYVGAWILSHEIKRHGYTWRAVGAYNSPTEEKQQVYVRKVQRRLFELKAGL